MGYRRMKDIIIVCAGNYGKEVYYTIRRVNEAAIRDGKEAPYHMIGFLSDVPDALELPVYFKEKEVDEKRYLK